MPDRTHLPIPLIHSLDLDVLYLATSYNKGVRHLAMWITRELVTKNTGMCPTRTRGKWHAVALNKKLRLRHAMHSIKSMESDGPTGQIGLCKLLTILNLRVGDHLQDRLGGSPMTIRAIVTAIGRR